MIGSHDIAADAVKVAPPLAVSAVTFAGWHLSDLAYVVTIVYTTLMIG